MCDYEDASYVERPFDGEKCLEGCKGFLDNHPIDWLLDDNASEEASEEEKAYRKRLNENAPILHKKIEEAIASISKS